MKERIKTRKTRKTVVPRKREREKKRKLRKRKPEDRVGKSRKSENSDDPPNRVTSTSRHLPILKEI